MSADSTIALGTNLPHLVRPVRISGGRCATDAGAEGPCVALDGTNSGAPLTVEADGVAVEEIAFIRSSTGIEIVAAEDFEVRGNWFGIELDGDQLDAIVGTGVLVKPGSSDGEIGGKAPEQANLFVHSQEGVEALGGSRVAILGNRFGFAPDEELADLALVWR